MAQIPGLQSRGGESKKFIGTGKSLTVWISVATSTVLVFYGYDQGVFGNVIVSHDFLKMASLYTLGSLFGAVSTIWTGDILGRPNTILAGSGIITIGAILQASAYGVPQMIVGRIIVGLGTGMNTATAGVWQSETSKPQSRGKLVMIHMAQCISGFSLSNWLTLGISFAPGSVAWRFPLAFQIVFAVILCCICPWLPDSPRLLIRKGQKDEALEVLAALEGEGATRYSDSVQLQYDIIKDVLDREHVNTYSWWTLLRGRGPAGVLRRMALGAGMQAMNQISGINATSYYTTYIFINALGFSEVRARILAAAGSVNYLIFALLSYLPIERYGRRRVFMTSSAVCSACFVAITIALYLSDSGKKSSFNMGVVAVAFFFVFWSAFGAGALGVPWLYASEINALEMRAKGASVAMSTNWIVNYAVVQVTTDGINNLHWRFWIIWAVLCASFVPITYLFYPETANRSLEDIDRFFETEPKAVICNNQLATQLKRPSEFEEADRVVQRHMAREGGACVEKSQVEQVDEVANAHLEGGL
ncbi:hypothetical protein PV08_02254 [Exophiala spinifera]|uniref:Major facilitator superfamily (MFS) profile domain-containing protein n=1 Tax=Exophiala spinifera TaxID=91928 RepID=A0A0D2CDQ2_9EURO|nr:uncharacterized protein PV08_02254 [Exophiala spinifera]KIW21674.1 hypothetical protein PV08_02254 [Exophiala spinifera]